MANASRRHDNDDGFAVARLDEKMNAAGRRHHDDDDGDINRMMMMILTRR